jgi:PAS domain S-box-containing protein
LTRGPAGASVALRRGGTIDGWEHFFRTVFDRSGNPMTLVDEALMRVDVNAATCALYGVGREMLVGRRIDGMLVDGRLPDTSPTWNDVVARGTASGSAVVVRPDGAHVDVDVAARAGRIDGRPLVLVVVTEAGEEETAGPPATAGMPLTAREQEVVHLLALGLTSREIADQMFVSHETIRTHVRNAMAKVEARTRAQLVANTLAGRVLTPAG